MKHCNNIVFCRADRIKLSFFLDILYKSENALTNKLQQFQLIHNDFGPEVCQSEGGK